MLLHSNEGYWCSGLTWTPGHQELTRNPDGSEELMWVHAGPFLFKPFGMSPFKGWYFYLGFRPTTWSAGYGDEGWLAKVAQWLKRHGWGNLGAASRFRL